MSSVVLLFNIKTHSKCQKKNKNDFSARHRVIKSSNYQRINFFLNFGGHACARPIELTNLESSCYAYEEFAVSLHI